MPYDSLLIVEDHRTISTPAASRKDGLMILGEALGTELSETGDGPAAFLLDEWEHGSHWSNPTIPIFNRRK
jgi:hypothetical protein